MRPIDVRLPFGPLPEQEEQEAFWNQYLFDNYQITERFRQILDGKTVLGGLVDEEWPNVDTAVVDLVLDQGTNNEVNNPLDREPVGIIPLISPGIVRPRWNMYTASVSVTNDSTTVTTTSTFSTDMALGYLIAQSSKAKILSRLNATTLTLYEAWPGATAPGINASVMYKWDSDTVWLYCGGTVGWPGLYRLMFF